MQGLAQAQRNYDRQEPEYVEPEPKLPFNYIDVELFIVELSKSSDPVAMLEDYGCPVDSTLANMLVEMCVNWQRNPGVVASAAGSNFFQLMKAAALERYNQD